MKMKNFLFSKILFRLFDQLTVESDKKHLMLFEEYELDRLHYDVLLVDNNDEKRQDFMVTEL